MLKVTKTTYTTVLNNRRNHSTIEAQKMRKDGTWGAPSKYQTIGDETPEQCIERLEKNNGTKYRLCE